MRIPTFFVPPAAFAQEADRLLLLEGDEANHLARVLRLKVGAEVVAFDGEGNAVRCAVDVVERRTSRLRVLGPVERSPELPFRLTCAIATPKRKRRQRLIETLTELGVTDYHPLQTRRAQNQDPDLDQVERWSLEAAKQCQRSALLRAHTPLDLAGLIAARAEHDLALLPDTARAQPLARVLAEHAAPPGRVLVAIGPEGGFDDDERDALHAGGFTPIQLGGTVLRIETAAAAVIGALVTAWTAA